MFDFGIGGYRPVWHTGRVAIARAHGDRLARLIGRRRTEIRLVWDRRDDEWFSDCPVLLDFEGEQVAVQHQKFDELSVTWDPIDTGRRIRWAGFDLVWRPAPGPEPAGLRDRPLRDVTLLQLAGAPPTTGAADVSFVFDTGRVTVFNAMDENGLRFDPPGPEQREHPLR